MKNTKILALLLIVVFAFSLTLGVTAAQNDATIAVELNSSTATQVNVDLVIKNNPGFDNLQFYVYYDAEVLKYSDFSAEGSIVPSTKSWTPGGANSGYVICTVLDMMENFGLKDPILVSGDGLIVTLTFDVLEGATAETAISVVSKYAYITVDGKETSIPFSAAGSDVKVSVKDGAVVGATKPTDPTTPTQPTEPVTPPTDPACDHKNTFERVITPATCGKDGVKDIICGDCYTPVEKGVVIPATGDHEPEQILGKAATCTEDGLTTGSKCKVCGYIILAQKPIPAAHDLENVPGKAATCGEAGLSDGVRCKVCGVFTVEQKPTPATEAHSRVKVNGTPASCGVAGLTDGEVCSVCGYVFVEQEVIPAVSEHNFVEEGKVEPTCLNNGSLTSKCTLCGEKKTEVLQKLDHTPVALPGVDATCTTTGLTAGEKCSVCGTVITAQEIIPAIDHVYGEWVVSKEATCTAEGLKVSTCVCGASKSEVIPAVAHTEVKDAAVAATCTDDGLTAGSHCSVCNTVIVAQKKVPAAGHKNNLVSENEDGKNYKCSVCGETSFVPHEENPPTTDSVVTFAVIALVLMSASALVIFNGKKWTVG